MITISVDTRGLEAKVLELAAITKKSTRDALKQEAGLLAVELVRYTQPFADAGDKSRKKAHEAGIGKIKRDYGRVYPDIAADFILDRVGLIARPKDRDQAKARLRGYLAARQYTSARKMLLSMKIANVVVDANPALHAQRWNRGVLKGGPTQIVINRASVDALILQAVKMSGFAKSGWSACARQLGADLRNVPAWVRNQRGPGSVAEGGGDDKPTVTITNRINYTDQVLSASGLRSAIKDREIKLTARIKAAIDHPPQHA